MCIYIAQTCATVAGRCVDKVNMNTCIVAVKKTESINTFNERSNKKSSDIEVACEISKSFNENFMNQTPLFVLKSNCIPHHVSHSVQM